MQTMEEELEQLSDLFSEIRVKLYRTMRLKKRQVTGNRLESKNRTIVKLTVWSLWPSNYGGAEGSSAPPKKTRAPQEL